MSVSLREMTLFLDSRINDPCTFDLCHIQMGRNIPRDQAKRVVQAAFKIMEGAKEGMHIPNFTAKVNGLPEENRNEALVKRVLKNVLIPDLRICHRAAHLTPFE